MAKHNDLTRRAAMAALGLGLASPLAFRSSRVARAQAVPRPPRLFIFFIPHGVPWEHFDPVGPNGALDFNASGIGGFSPLEPYRSSVTVLRGISMANDAHDHNAIRAALTGFPEGGTVDSIDYTIAKSLGVRPHVLGAFPYAPADGFTQDSYLAKHGGAWVRALESPLAAADELFGVAAAGMSGTPAVDETPFEQEALALGQTQVARLARGVKSLAAEESKLGVHLQALQSLATAGAPTATACPTRPALPATRALAGVDPLDPTAFGHVLDAHLEVAANAMVCGAARVITLQTMYARCDLRFDFLDGPGIAAEHHLGLSHVVDPREPYARAQQWLIGRLATKLLSVLAQPDPLDPAHSVLDNSIVYVLSEISDGSAHNSDAEQLTVGSLPPLYTYLPQVLIGGGAGYFKPGGRVVQVQDERPHTDVLATIAAAMGARVSDLGGQAISEIEELKA
ncbi:MAG TPA: DUF1552 domain-containing protein [Polyangia bacterium]|jgi:hypothetical protein